MTPEQITLVKDSWAQVAPDSAQVADLFYGRLFEKDPVYKVLFTRDITKQGEMLMTMLNTAVAALDKLDEVVPAIQALGHRHVRYGVKPEDYDAVGEALLWTLGQGLGESFAPEVEEAWTETYNTLAAVMIEAGNEVAT